MAKSSRFIEEDDESSRDKPVAAGRIPKPLAVGHSLNTYTSSSRLPRQRHRETTPDTEDDVDNSQDDVYGPTSDEEQTRNTIRSSRRADQRARFRGQKCVSSSRDNRDNRERAASNRRKITSEDDFRPTSPGAQSSDHRIRALQTTRPGVGGWGDESDGANVPGVSHLMSAFGDVGMPVRNEPFLLDVDFGLEKLPYAEILAHVLQLEAKLRRHEEKLAVMSEEQKVEFAGSIDGRNLLKLVVVLDSLKHGLQGVIDLALTRAHTPVHLAGVLGTLNVNWARLVGYPKLAHVMVKDESAFIFSVFDEAEGAGLQIAGGLMGYQTYYSCVDPKSTTFKKDIKSKLANGYYTNTPAAKELHHVLQHGLGIVQM